MNTPEHRAVFACADEMLKKLNTHENQTYKTGWHNLSHKWCANRARQELGELARAIEGGDPEDIKQEAADVGNFMAFIIDNINQAAAKEDAQERPYRTHPEYTGQIDLTTTE